MDKQIIKKTNNREAKGHSGILYYSKGNPV